MAAIGPNCFLKHTDLAEKLRQIIPVLNLEIGAKNGKPTFRQIYKALVKEMGVELDLDSFAEMYQSEIPSELRFTTDTEVDAIINKSTKAQLDRLTNGIIDSIDGVGETGTSRAATNKIAGILTALEGNNKSVKTKTMAKKVKDAILSQIQRLANSNPDYAALKKQNAKETFDQTLERLFDIMNSRTETLTADKFNTVEDVLEGAKKTVMEQLGDLRDEDGEVMLGEESLSFLEDYKNAVFGVLMSTGDAAKLVRGFLLEAGYSKGEGNNKKVDWKGLAGSVNSAALVKENVIKALMENKGLSQEAATSIASSLSKEFKDLVQSEKALQVKYALAEAEAADILEKLTENVTPAMQAKITEGIENAINESVATQDEINITDIVHQVLEDVGIDRSRIANLPEKSISITSSVADKIAKIVKEDGDLDADAVAALYKALGKVVDGDVVRDLQRLTKLKNQIDATEITFGPDSKLSNSKIGIEKAKLIQTISDQMARAIVNGIDYSDKTWFQRKLAHALNGFSKYISWNASLVLLNPFNLTQNILSGAFVNPQAKIGGKVDAIAGGVQTSLMYKTDDGKQVNLTSLLNTSGKFETWWNTLIGNPGRDIPDLFSGDLSKESATFKTATGTVQKAEAALNALPRAALTATDSALKEPFYRNEVIRGVLYYLQKAKGFTKQQAQKMVYEALTNNKHENLMGQAKQLASMVGKGDDKFYVKQVAEDIQMASLVVLDKETGFSVLSERTLQAIIDAAKQTSGEAFGHLKQKNVFVLSWFFDLITGGKARAVDSMNIEYHKKIADLYKMGDYTGAAQARFWHTLQSSAGFLFQRGIYNWAIMVAQKNPLSIITGFANLKRQITFDEEGAGTQKTVENYLRARAKIGRGVMGTITAAAVGGLFMAAMAGMSDDERRKWLARLKRDPVWGRLYKNFVSPFAQSFIEAFIAKDISSGVGTGLQNMAIKPIISAGSKYYSTDNLLIQSLTLLESGEPVKSGNVLGQVLGNFLPGKSFLSTNKPLAERIFGEKSPKMFGDNWQIVTDQRKREKTDDFAEAWWYSSVFNK